ncbi:MAG: LamG domain-containing protein [Planctomycetota bacterium]|nr:MAG: LamG domain-containing protein [Planctomycetota bacterium]
MSKRYFLISITLVLGLASSVSAQGEYIGRISWWSDRAAGQDWNEPNNWWTADRYEDNVGEVTTYVKVDPNEVPEGNTPAYIGKSDAHTPYPPDLNSSPPLNDPWITSGTFNPSNIAIGGGYSLDPFQPGSVIHFDDPNWDPDPNHILYMSGGTVNVGEPVTWENYDVIIPWYGGSWYGRWSGAGNVYIGTVGWRAGLLWPLPPGEPSGTMVMSGGELNVGGHMEVGSWEEAHGTLDMTGGTINVTQGIYCPASWWGNNILTGQINLNGGTINAKSFTMISGASTGNLDVTEGKMVLVRNETEKFASYVAGEVEGMSITAYGVGHGQLTGGGQRAALSIDYDVSNEGKTTVSAALTEPGQAWVPNPPAGAANVKGPPTSLQRPELSWSAGDTADTHQVYFGTSFTEVDNADTSSGAYKGSQLASDVNWTVGTDLPPLAQYYWRIDEVNATTVKGQVWDFTIANLGKASYPDPDDGEDGVSTDKILGWASGIYATSHDVYFGTNFDDVNEATTSVDPNGVFMGNQTGNTFDVKDYDPNGLVFNTTYYWPIDETNGVTTYLGNVWSFTTAAHLTVDDFDSYAINDDLWAVWDDYWTNGSGSEIFVEKEIAQDGNSLMFVYLNTYMASGKLIGSFIDADISDLKIGPDWTVSDARALVINFFGQEDNSTTVNDKMWVELEDTSSNTGVAIYDGDPNDVKEASWHEWNIDLEIFDACGVSLKNLDKVHLGFGNEYRTGQAEKGGSGTVYFDDIQVWPQRCLPTHASIADFTNDCIVDEYDLETMMEDWLLQDYNTLGYMGTLRGFTDDPLDPNYDLCWVPGRIGTGALEFGVGHILTDPNCTNNCYAIHEPELDDDVLIPPLLLNTNTVTFTCWVKAHGPQWPDTGLFGCDGEHGEFPSDTVVNWDLGTNGASDMGYNWNNDQATWGFNPEIPELPYNKWAFVALAIGPTEATIYLREDNDSTLHLDSNPYDHAPEPFDIPGHIGSHKWRYFDGVIDDFRIYDRTLSISEVEWLAYQSAQGTDPTDANLYAHYEFDDGSGLTAMDSAGTGLNYWPVPSVANIAGDDIEPEYGRFVNLIDFAALADDWLVYKPWP